MSGGDHRLAITIVTPAPPGSRKGNRLTADRWARFLRELGHRVQVEEEWRGRRSGLLLALHARKSHASIRRFWKQHPDLPLVVALTGTDLYGDLRRDRRARLSLEMATRLVVLQPLGISALPARLRKKALVVMQSARRPPGKHPPRGDAFEVVVMGHLRPVKDPFRAARAARLLPRSSRVRVLHLGGALEPAMARQARLEEARNPRYRWLGDLPLWRALRVLARARLLVLSSLMEGGANVLSEAIACGVPVIASRIPGSVGILGADYPGYFPVRATRELARLLHRAETAPPFLRRLRRRVAALRPLAREARERRMVGRAVLEAARAARRLRRRNADGCR